jgi:hypothetical protein
VHVGPDGTNTSMDIQACSFRNNSLNAKIDSSTAAFTINASSDGFKFTQVANTINGIASILSENKTYIIGDTEYFFNNLNSLNLNKFFYTAVSTGVIYGGNVTNNGGLSVNVTNGEGLIRIENNGSYAATNVSWDSITNLTLTANTTNYVLYQYSTDSIIASTSIPGDRDILLATVITDNSEIRYLHHTVYYSSNIPYIVQDFIDNVHGVTHKTGLVVSQGSTIKKFSVTSGSYYVSLIEINFSGVSDAVFSYFYGNGWSTEVSSQTDLDITYYDNNGSLTAMTSGYYRVDSIYLTSDGRISVKYGTKEYSTQTLAENASIAEPSSFIEPTGCSLAKIIVQQGVGISKIIDARPTIGSSSVTGGSSEGGVTDHGDLTGLNDDDHTQYLLINGSRAMSGSLSIGGNNITNVNLVDGVDISSHGHRHQPGNVDAIPTGIASNLLVGGSPSEGSSNLFARDYLLRCYCQINKRRA